MGWRNVKVQDLREYLVKSYTAKVASMSDLCEECGISRKTGYKWYNRYLKGGYEALADQTRAPHVPHKQYSDEVIKTVLELKLKNLKVGPKKLYKRLKGLYPDQEWPSPTRLYEIFKDHHLVTSRKLRRRVPRTQPLGEINSSNEVWCADFKGWFMTGDKTKVEPLTITDGFSRFLIRCQHLERKTFEEVWRVYSDAFYEYGLPLRIRTDNGPPFATTGVGRLSKLAINLIKAGVTPEWIEPGHPEQNGRHERFHRTLKEAVAKPPASTFSEQIQRLQVFTEEYNFERPHEGLDMEVPGSCYTPSTRQWDGKLRPPEYTGNDIKVRKVGDSGCIYLRKKHFYLGSVLRGEYVGLESLGMDEYRVFYGPILLGSLVDGGEFRKP